MKRVSLWRYLTAQGNLVQLCADHIPYRFPYLVIHNSSLILVARHLCSHASLANFLARTAPRNAP